MGNKKRPSNLRYKANNAGGKGNPPVDRQFQPGNPGGPGRPPGETSLAAALRKMFNDKVPVVENGKRVKKHMSEAIAKRGQQHILTGPPGAFFRGLELLNRFGQVEIEEGEESTSVENLTFDEMLVFTALLRKVRIVGPNGKAEEVEPFDAYYREKICGEYVVSFDDKGVVVIARNCAD